ncbi:MAG: hypothetical protein WC807_21235 [Hyphomicrobium sp.]|jgi:hypothetical protein
MQRLYKITRRGASHTRREYEDGTRVQGQVNRTRTATYRRYGEGDAIRLTPAEASHPTYLYLGLKPVGNEEAGRDA